jgi:hypothetical protein
MFSSIEKISFSIFLLCGLLVVSLSACNDSKSKPVTTAIDFNEIYKTLYLVHYSPDYPGSTQVLTYCLNNRNEGSCRVFARVSEVVSQLQKLDHDKAVAAIADAIGKYCDSPIKSGKPDVVLCEGALTSVYLFNNKADDAVLISVLNGLGKKTNARIFYTNKAWYYNRKNTEPWLNLVNEMLEGSDLQLQTWRFNQRNIKPFGLMYLDQPVSTGNIVTH